MVDFLPSTENHTVRMVGTVERPEWIAADVCGVLGISNPRDTVSRFKASEKGVGTTDTLGGEQKMLTVTEPGLYRLIFKSRKTSVYSRRISRLGELMKGMPKAKAGRPTQEKIGGTDPPINPPTLDSLGINKNLAKSARVASKRDNVTYSTNQRHFRETCCN